MGDTCLRGCQLRPFVVWFGEAVPAIEQAIDIVQQTDLLAIVGTSMNVFPVAGLIHYLSKEAPIYLIDPKTVSTPYDQRITFIQQPALIGILLLGNRLSFT